MRWDPRPRHLSIPARTSSLRPSRHIQRLPRQGRRREQSHHSCLTVVEQQPTPRALGQLPDRTRFPKQEVQGRVPRLPSGLPRVHLERRSRRASPSAPSCPTDRTKQPFAGQGLAVAHHLAGERRCSAARPVLGSWASECDAGLRSVARPRAGPSSTGRDNGPGPHRPRLPGTLCAMNGNMR